MQDHDVGERIRRIRQQLDLTQSEFSKKLGVIQVSVARYEAGRVPRAQVLEKIARIGGVTTSWLLHGEATETTDPRGRQTTPKELSDVMRLLNPDWDSKTWSKLSHQLRTRYQERAREVADRLVRELEEYRKVLEAERRLGSRRR
jgi:transcriptional regulator with XRE-family HTH domain